MDDLISRQAALKAIDNLPRSYRTKEQRARVGGYADVAMVIEELPSAERRGRWVKGDEMADYPRVPYKPWETYCSCCGEIKEQTNDGFCGNCGAKMEVEE